MKRPELYTQTEYWKKYNEFLPKDFQYKETNMPIETYWKWKTLRPLRKSSLSSKTLK